MIEDLSDLTFEMALAALQEAVEQLESGELSLEESLAIFERGQKLAAYCNNLLEQAALKVEQLTSDGEIINISPPPAG
ncbi:MAG: exodeoxyribonuclease VII small subunit [Candidatus Promineifilaceae bacterium]|jgi:exodeoxyribonuclease VII small subunit